MKKLIIVPLSLVVFAIFFSAVVYVWWRQNSKPVSTNTQEVDFLVTKGKGASQIAQDLYSKELIKNPLAFKIYVQIRDYSDKIQAGRYSLSPNLDLPQVVDILIKGPKDVWVTIPEGLRREEVVERFIQGLGKTGQEEETFRQEFLDASYGAEGYLFPDTYLFPKDVNAENVVSAMRNTFDKKLGEIGGVENTDLKLEEIVILASIIERETKTDEERPVVSGILLNRLDIGMGLQADATVQYAIGSVKCEMGSETLTARNEKCNWWGILTKEDLAIDSPYNTYRYKGLPPGPISNPGLSSLKAAVNPEESDYLYYLHDSEGGIHYAKTLDEHNENVRLFLKR